MARCRGALPSSSRATTAMYRGLKAMPMPNRDDLVTRAVVSTASVRPAWLRAAGWTKTEGRQPLATSTGKDKRYGPGTDPDCQRLVARTVAANEGGSPRTPETETDTTSAMALPREGIPLRGLYWRAEILRISA